MKKEIVEDFAADNYEQELDILNSMTEATKDDPDYAIEEESPLLFLQLDRICFQKFNFIICM